MDGTRAAFVSMTSTSDDLAGWRDARLDGGVIMGLRKNWSQLDCRCRTRHGCMLAGFGL